MDLSITIPGRRRPGPAGRLREAARSAPGRLLLRAGTGALAGAAAIVPMSALMLAADRLGIMVGQPPEDITKDTVERATGERFDGTKLDALAAALHFGVGAGAGAVYGVAAVQDRPGPSPVLGGAVFATGIWALSYLGWIPALGLIPAPTRSGGGLPLTMLAAHWVFGGTLGAVTGRSQPKVLAAVSR